MTFYLAKSPVGPHYAFTSRDDAERFKVSRLDDSHAEVVEVVTLDKFGCFKCGDGNTPLYCLNCANDELKQHSPKP